MHLAAEDTRKLLDDLTGILLALGLLRERTPLSTGQVGLVDRALGSARDLERLAVERIARQRRVGGGLRHATAREWLGDALDGALAAPERGRLAAHLAACPPCRAFGRTLETTVALARQLPRAQMPPTARRRLRRLVAEAREVRNAVRARSGTGAAGSAAGAGAGPTGAGAARTGPGPGPDPVIGDR